LRASKWVDVKPEPVPEPEGYWLDLLRDKARRSIHPAVWAYLEAGAGLGVTAAEANRAWRAARFRPRVLRGVAGADQRTTILGAEVASPIAVAPTSMQPAVHPQGERAMAEGAGQAGCLHVVSSNAGTPFKDLPATAPWWLQAYLPPDRDLFRPVVEAAVAAGAQAVALTVDTPYPGNKRSAGHDWTGVDLGFWRRNYPEADTGQWKTDLAEDDVAWLRDVAGVPLVVKGVLRGDDALRCLDAGADAVYVSNHGGRQLDRAVTTAAALSEVVAAVEDRAEVYVDGGIRSGVDVLAALALGARAVLVGRPALWALGVDGARGLARLLQELTAELQEALELAGCASPADARYLL
jgi:4-hydroxymandelate oxidase